PSPEEAAQAAVKFADMDNLGKAFRIATADMPVALNSPRIVDALNKLYPNQCDFVPEERQTRSVSSCRDDFLSSDPFITEQLFDPDKIQESLSHIKRGGAAGALSDSPDVYTALFLSRPDDTSNEASSVNISLISNLLSDMLENQLPEDAREFFNNSRLIALHKDPTNDLKLRPIAIGSGIRRLLCGHISRVFRPYFAKFLAPYQCVGAGNSQWNGFCLSDNLHPG
ncbi:MAG: hypothetical protein ACREBR_02590, partial [bacterium]